ncbi:PAN2-PAN3 deadenylation complex subunit PAN3 [Erysiphe neolycopersici]|uniref:PAN2-PAN3 deadenylation complex subunit PAN3 n=1 Tax=Erysiphe neolycopersici TaxID=212602 RepID=A0A420HTI8_9PEZI|nr:PAN2-PAN3 deadenylation complex subunit PAN3 [Erysiphe neolycopersici]
MDTTSFVQPELRKLSGSPLPKGRENARNVLCRNVLIYGHCRYEELGCAFNHDPNRTLNAQPPDPKKSLSFDSPAFTPAILSAQTPPKVTSIKSHIANAAPFTPRDHSSSVTQNFQDPEIVPSFNPGSISEFTPANYELPQPLTTNDVMVDPSFEPFSLSGMNQALPATPFNPYLENATTMANTGAYFQAQTSFSAPTQPLQYHLYAPIAPHREDLLAYQRLTHEFFIANNTREELQRKSEATYQVIPNSQLPNIDHYHSLVPLDTNHHESAAVFGYPSWVYKAVSSKNGHTYVLRRLKGFRLSNEKAIRSVKDWKRVDSAGVVSIIDAFTTRAFGDSSLIFVCNYHPLSKTLVEYHFNKHNRFMGRAGTTTIPEQVLWSYIVQIASAIKSIHDAKLAVRCMDPSKVLMTEKNRIRLNACSIYDVIHFELDRPLSELQQEDFILFGKLILSLAFNKLNMSYQSKPNLDHLARTYSAELRDTITWLLTPATPPASRDINDFIRGISSHIITAYDSSLHANDDLTSTLCGELENGRLFRLMAKLGTINERPEYEADVKWSEVGERYILKLFRDYVFHQVDAQGKPVLDLGHILECLNKLDAGSAHQVKLVSRDNQDCMVVSYKELKKQVEAAFKELNSWGGKCY